MNTYITIAKRKRSFLFFTKVISLTVVNEAHNEAHAAYLAIQLLDKLQFKWDNIETELGLSKVKRKNYE